MPAKPGKSAKDVKRQYAAYVGRMVGPKTESAMALVLSIGITGAKELAPLEYGTLMNSAYRRINPTPTGIQGVAGFVVNYAYWLHERTNWSPRPPSKKAGPAWNPDAEPKFLEKGFTSPEQTQMMKIALVAEYRKP